MKSTNALVTPQRCFPHTFIEDTIWLRLFGNAASTLPLAQNTFRRHEMHYNAESHRLR